jgi:hypothetical protein
MRPLVPKLENGTPLRVMPHRQHSNCTWETLNTCGRSRTGRDKAVDVLTVGEAKKLVTTLPFDTLPTRSRVRFSVLMRLDAFAPET